MCNSGGESPHLLRGRMKPGKDKALVKGSKRTPKTGGTGGDKGGGRKGPAMPVKGRKSGRGR